MATSTGPDGLLVVDKPGGWTSHDVVARARRLLGTKKVGHAGTLDPMATGVLVLGVGRATRLLTFLVGADKEYVATIRLGQATDSDDAEGEVVAAAGARDVDPGALAAGVAALIGPISQVPSTVSAIKVAGRRAYDLARAGEEVVLASRPVVVHAFEVGEPRAALAADGTPVLDLEARVVCSSGTYVRALARDLGAALGTGGHLTALRRTRVGGFGLDGAVDVDVPVPARGAAPDPTLPAPEPPALLDLAAAARVVLPARELSDDEARELSFGRGVPVVAGQAGTREAPVAAFAPDGTLVALVADERGRARPVLVLAPA
jgi:tRNA pseudouridine55 synthase